MIIIRLMLVLGMITISQAVSAQKTVTITDTHNNVIGTLVYKNNKIKDPEVATWCSTFLPGMGQVYNGRWWKVPFIYGGFAFLGWLYNWNDNYYKTFLTEATRKANGQPPLDAKYANASYQGLVDVKDFYRRNRDLTLFSIVALWGVNIVDAYVDARFFQFDITDDLSLNIKPQMSIINISHLYITELEPYYGLQIKIKL